MKYELNNESVDIISQELADFFAGCGIAQQDILRMRLSLEEALICFLDRMGTGKTVTVHTAKRLGNCRFDVSVPGESVQPFVESGEDEYLNMLLSQVGQLPSWSYRKGVNHLSFSCAVKRKISMAAKVLIALILGLAAGAAANRFLGADTAVFISDELLDPIMNAIMGFMSAAASMLVFSTMISSICGVGDVSTFSRIGKRTLLQFMIVAIVYTALAALIYLPFFRISSGSGEGGGMQVIYAMIVDIVPKDFISPFMTGNTLQIIFLATVLGTVILVLGSKAATVRDVIIDTEKVSTMLIGAVSELIPIVIFVSIFSISADGNYDVILKAIKGPILLIAACVAMYLVSLFRICFSNRAKPAVIFAKMKTTMLMGLTTASSSLCLPFSMEDCKRLGIGEKVRGIGLPLGTVLFKPTIAAVDIVVCMCFANSCGIAMSTQWVIRLFVIAFLLSCATPPIAGGGVASYLILFNQLGIPVELISVVLALDFIMDRVSTGVKFGVLELELVQIAKSLNMLDADTLRERNV